MSTQRSNGAGQGSEGQGSEALGRELRRWVDEQQENFVGGIPESILRNYLKDRADPDTPLLPALLHSVELPLFRKLLEAKDPNSRAQISRGLVDQQKDLYNQETINGLREFLQGFMDVAIIYPDPPPTPPSPWQRLLTQLRRQKREAVRVDSRPRLPRTRLLGAGGLLLLLYLGWSLYRMNDSNQNLTQQVSSLTEGIKATCKTFSIDLINNTISPKDAAAPEAKRLRAIQTMLTELRSNCSAASDYHSAIGLSHEKLQEWDAAITAYRAATIADNNDPWNYWKMAAAFYNSDPEKHATAMEQAASSAIANYEKDPKRYPNSYGHSESYALRGEARKRQKRPSEALSDFDQAIRLGYRGGWAYYARGQLNRDLGHQEAACSDFKQALALGYSLARIDLFTMPGCLVPASPDTTSTNPFQPRLP